MPKFTYQSKTYDVDDQRFLVQYDDWDESFAEGMARELKMTGALSKDHWDVIGFIRSSFEKTGRCPLVYETCRMNGLVLKELKNLFPTGYLRGACKLAGITYKEGYLGQARLPLTADDLNLIANKKIYRVDVRGFLIDPKDWDEFYAAFRAHDMKIAGGRLTDRHWEVIHFLRRQFGELGRVPTVYEVCESLPIGLEELEELFPDGYHRGAVKVAGLRVR